MFIEMLKCQIRFHPMSSLATSDYQNQMLEDMVAWFKLMMPFVSQHSFGVGALRVWDGRRHRKTATERQGRLTMSSQCQGQPLVYQFIHSK